MSTRRDEFIKMLAEYLAGPNQAEMSIRLEMGHEDARVWSMLRDASPLFGYPSVDDAEQRLKKFLLEEAQPTPDKCDVSSAQEISHKTVNVVVSHTHMSDWDIAAMVSADLDEIFKKLVNFLDTCFEHSLCPGDAEGLLRQFHNLHHPCVRIGVTVDKAEEIRSVNKLVETAENLKNELLHPASIGGEDTYGLIVELDNALDAMQAPASKSIPPKATKPSKFARELTERLVSKHEDFEEYLHGGSTPHTDVAVACTIDAAIFEYNNRLVKFLDNYFHSRQRPGNAEWLLQQFRKQENEG